DTNRAVAAGLQRSGRIITSAAFLVLIVFLGFAAGRSLGVKEFGLALAIAVAVDATLVRCILVPATMTLLGPANWWAPAPLRRLHRHLGLHETPAHPVGGTGTPAAQPPPPPAPSPSPPHPPNRTPPHARTRTGPAPPVPARRSHPGTGPRAPAHRGRRPLARPCRGAPRRAELGPNLRRHRRSARPRRLRRRRQRPGRGCREHPRAI